MEILEVFNDLINPVDELAYLGVAGLVYPPRRYLFWLWSDFGGNKWVMRSLISNL